MLDPLRIVHDVTIGEELRSFERRDIRRSKWVNNSMHTWASVGLTGFVVSLTLTAEILPNLISAPLAVDELAAFFTIGVMSHSLGVLGHECYHNSFFRSPRANQIFGAWLFHYPFLGRFHMLKDIHLRHHRYFGTHQDPDIDHWGWEHGDSRHFVQIMKLLFGIVFIENCLRALRLSLVRPGVASAGTSAGGGGAASDLLGILACQIGIAAVFANFLSLERYFFLWILPTVTVGATVEHLRVFAEHNGGRLRIFIEPSAVEKSIFSRANFRLHALHHQAPSVPWFALGSKYATVKARIGEELVESPSYLSEIKRIGLLNHES
jgi:fatty acid desaturase